MEINELEKLIQIEEEKTNKVFKKMDRIVNESYRVSEVARNTKNIFDDLEYEFKKKTELKGKDITFLFFAVALQCARIYIINNLTKIEKAGHGNENEKKLKNIQKNIFKNFNSENFLESVRYYYAPLNQIITTLGVPYDTTSFADSFSGEKIFKGANHRFSTLAHDPILGYIFGTANILTNTITTINLPIISTYHVSYNELFKYPKIGFRASTIEMLHQVYNRWEEDKLSIVAAIIKQTIHIGTDLFTTCGIQIPGANLILNKKNVENLTKIVSTGDIIKIGASAGLAVLINTIIGTLHSLLYNEKKDKIRELYNVRTRKILMYSNIIASSSNLIWVGLNLSGRNMKAIKDLDIGGLIVTIYKIVKDKRFIFELKKEFIYSNFDKMITGEKIKIDE